MGVATIGLTGGIGSGKSTVASLLVRAGACLVDTDVIARQLTLPGGAALPDLIEAFGSAIVAADGGLDREQMRGRAFADRAAKQQLESILHPLIGAEAERQAGLAQGRPVVFDVPLLAESSRWRHRVDRVIVVDCPEDVQVERVTRRSNWDAAAVRRVISQQASGATRRAVADALIYNGAATSLEALAEHVAALWAAWIGPPASLWNN